MLCAADSRRAITYQTPRKSGCCCTRFNSKGITMAQRKPKMAWPEILAKLHLGGMTLTELGKRNDIPLGSITRVKSQTHYKAQQAIAKFIGEKPEELWPDRYPMGRPRILDTAKFPPVASQKSGDVADNLRVA